MTDMHEEPGLFDAPTVEPEPAETPAEPDLFEANVRLREACGPERVVPAHDQWEALLQPGECIVDAADLAAVLDVPGRHALTDESIYRAIDAANREGACLVRTHPKVRRQFRAAIAAALNQEPPV